MDDCCKNGVKVHIEWNAVYLVIFGNEFRPHIRDYPNEDEHREEHRQAEEELSLILDDCFIDDLPNVTFVRLRFIFGFKSDGLNFFNKTSDADLFGSILYRSLVGQKVDLRVYDPFK